MDGDMKISEVAKLLQVTPRAVRAWCAQGLVGHKVGARWRIPQDQLRAFMLRGLPVDR